MPKKVEGCLKYPRADRLRLARQNKRARVGKVLACCVHLPRSDGRVRVSFRAPRSTMEVRLIAVCIPRIIQKFSLWCFLSLLWKLLTFRTAQLFYILSWLVLNDAFIFREMIVYRRKTVTVEVLFNEKILISGIFARSFFCEVAQLLHRNEILFN